VWEIIYDGMGGSDLKAGKGRVEVQSHECTFAFLHTRACGMGDGFFLWDRSHLAVLEMHFLVILS